MLKEELHQWFVSQLLLNCPNVKKGTKAKCTWTNAGEFLSLLLFHNNGHPSYWCITTRNIDHMTSPAD